MRKKANAAEAFVCNLHEPIVSDPQFRKDAAQKSESQIQTELRPLVIQYLENYFSECGYKDAKGKAHKSFYWEGQEGRFGKIRETTSGRRNIVEKPQAPFSN